MGNWCNCVGIWGQEMVKRALEVAAAGGHNVLMSGPPLPLVAGKTLLARSLPSILPRMMPTEALDVTRIYSVADTAQRAVRHAPHPPAALPCAAPYHLQRGAGGRRALAAAGRDQPGAPRSTLPS